MIFPIEAPPEEFISSCLRSGKVIPDETDPWDPSKFHANWQGYEAGHADQEARKKWFALPPLRIPFPFEIISIILIILIILIMFPRY